MAVPNQFLYSVNILESQGAWSMKIQFLSIGFYQTFFSNFPGLGD